MREHEVFQSPQPIDTTATVEVATPAAWKDEVDGSRVAVLPLVADVETQRRPGWTSYTSRFGDAPEVEVMCGGINTKTVTAAAVWRQGNLLHFGFYQTPAELIPAGRDLLENCIHYVARFTEDRPIARAPSVFVTGSSISDRDSILRRLRDEEYRFEWLVDRFAPGERERLESMGRQGYAERFAQHLGQVTIDSQGLTTIDADLVALGTANHSPELFERCLHALQLDADEAPARRALARYLPEGPGAGAPAEEWLAWVEDHRPYLFWSATGGYRWYVDPLAKARGVPSAELRGPARADATARDL